MGREKTILLGVLGLLAGVFVGVLSLKLLVPRPPAGTGPDIRVDVAATTAQERVAPPAPSAVAWDFSSAPPLVPAATAPEPAAPPVVDQPRTSAFGAPVASVADPDVAPVSWRRAVDAPAGPEASTMPPIDPPLSPRFAPPTTASSAPDEITRQQTPTSAAVEAAPAGDPFRGAASAQRAAPVAGTYLVQAGDSWWVLAERAYGDGRLYRALFAWNRGRDPRVTLAPGTRLDVPPLDRLEAAWPRLTTRAAPR